MGIATNISLSVQTSIRNYLQKISITVENRNADEHTKVHETC